MKIISTAVAVCILAAAGSAFAQTAIAPGQTLSGQLSGSDPTLSDDSHYDCFALKSRQGVGYAVEMRSEDFDTYLGVGRGSCAGEMDETDDDGAGGTDSRVDIAGTGGLLYIRANSLSAGDTGRYSLSVTERAATAPTTVAVTTLGWGATVEGELSRGDAIAADDSFYDCLAFTGQQGQRAVIDMRSDDFDTYLSLYRGGACEGDQLESNDDGAGGTDSRIEISLPASGRYSVRANSLSAGETGRYRVTLGGQSSAAITDTSSIMSYMPELESCLYRPGSRVIERASGKTDSVAYVFIIGGREVDVAQAGASQADGRSWFTSASPVRIANRNFVKYGLPRILGYNEVEYFAEHDGVVFAAERGVRNPEVLYALTRAVGCEFQPYQVQG